MIPRWTTARAVSRGADFRSREVEPTWVPSKEKTGRVASSERRVRENLGLSEWKRSVEGG